MSKFFLGLAALSFSLSANAVHYEEMGDADELTPSFIGDGIERIDGELAPDNSDVDLYSFIWGGGDLTITTEGHSGTLLDSQLFLFDDAGNGLFANDDTFDTPGNLSTMDLVGLAAGTYYLGISAWDHDPLDAGASEIFAGCGITDLCVGSGQLDSWDDGGIASGGTYQIFFSAATGPAVMPAPEPGIILLLGMGLAGLGLARRKRF